MSDRNFNDFDDDFDDDFEDDDFLDSPRRDAREMGGDRDAAVIRPFVQEIEQIPPEHLANLLQMIRLFRQSVALAEQTARTEADSLPIQPTVLLREPIDTASIDIASVNIAPDIAPIDTPSIAPDVPPIAPVKNPIENPIENPTGIDPIEKLLMRSQFDPPRDRPTEQAAKPPLESPQTPPLVPLRLPRTSESAVEPGVDSLEVAEPVEYVVEPATENESDWDELMDFLDQDNPKDFREEDSRNDDWDEYFRPSP